MRSSDPAHRSTYRARSATLSSRTFSAASVAPRAAAGTTVGASSNSVASEGGGLEASPTKSLVADSEVCRSRCDSCSMFVPTTAWGCQRFGAFVDGVDTARRVRGVARRTRRKVKRKRRDRGRSGMTYRLVSASKARLRVDRSASEMPFRSRWMLARNAAASVASPIARVRPGARSQSTEPTNVPDRKTTSATPGSDCRSAALSTQSTTAVVPFPSFRERPTISEKGEKRRRSLTVDPLLGARSTRGRIAARARRARFGPRREQLRSAVSTRRTVAVFRVWRNGRRDEVGGRDVRFGRGR